MSALPKPFELFELPDKAVTSFTPTAYEEGRMTIQPRTPANAPVKEIDALRVHVTGKDKPIGLPYYDITSTTLIAQLTPLLPNAIAAKKKITITAFGIAPAKRFTVEVV